MNQTAGPVDLAKQTHRGGSTAPDRVRPATDRPYRDMRGLV
jgi:hypothetical protein